MYDHAVIAAEKAAVLTGDVYRRAFLARAYGLAGQENKALRIRAELLSLQKRGYVPPTAFAHIHLGLGELDEAIAWVEKGLRRPRR